MFLLALQFHFEVKHDYELRNDVQTCSSYFRPVVIVSDYNSLQWSNPHRYACSKARQQSLLTGRTINIVWTCISLEDKT